MDLVILNYDQVTKTTPELALPPLLTTAPHYTNGRIVITPSKGVRPQFEKHCSNITERESYDDPVVVVWGGIMLNGQIELNVFDRGSVTRDRYCKKCLFRRAIGPGFVSIRGVTTKQRRKIHDRSRNSEPHPCYENGTYSDTPLSKLPFHSNRRGLNLGRLNEHHLFYAAELQWHQYSTGTGRTPVHDGV
ncbi:hypothetical protein TNCV_4924921 [Trichonephila clavipes]|nr:hypothetical protein TNCV_4924921 [Trichonephila clavipes]